MFRAAKVPAQKKEYAKLARHRRVAGVLVFVIVFAVQFAFGMWMNSRGLLWNDAVSRATSALQALYGSDPHLGAVGFVWMPLPTLIQLLWVTIYPLWPGVVSSGFSSTLTTALAGAATAVVLLVASSRFGLPKSLGWSYALVVSANPMILLFAANGMSEGVAAPFLTSTVCFLILFWYSGHRRYVAVAGLALALSFACLYQAAPYGAGLFVALVLGVVLSRESKKSAPQGKWRAVEGLGLLFLVPSVYVAALWIGANAVIVGDPLYFATSQYSNEGYIQAFGEQRITLQVAGEPIATTLFVAARSWPFLLPGAFLLALRSLEGRLWDGNTLSLVVLLLSVPLGLISPQVYTGDSFAWLRYFMYPLFVAAGWGLYEIAISRRRRLAVGLVFAGWVLAAPAIVWAMSVPEMGQDEYKVVEALVTGRDAEEVDHPNYIGQAETVAEYLEAEILPQDGVVVALDSLQGWPIAAQVSPEHQRKLLLPSNREFENMIARPRERDVSHLLLPNPEKVPGDTLLEQYPGLWEGDSTGFRLVESFPDTPRQWRLYEVGEG